MTFEMNPGVITIVVFFGGVANVMVVNKVLIGRYNIEIDVNRNYVKDMIINMK